MPAREALIIASSSYQDDHLKQLVAPPQDAEELARVFGDPSIGDFKVTTILNKSSAETRLAIEGFFSGRKHDDLLLLYFSGHGLKDVAGQLYLATMDTKYDLLRATSVSARFINEIMRTSRSRKQVLLLDCCYSGAFTKGAVAKAGFIGSAAGTGQQFGGQGRVVITASDAMQYAFEEDDLSGKGVQSVFTNGLVHGLKSGEADLDRDGNISLDELYEFVHDYVVERQPRQVPEKSVFNVRGDVIIASSPVIRPAQLPVDLQETLDSPLPWVRSGAVGELGKLLDSTSEGIALSARLALEALVEDDSQQVSKAAAELLGLSPPVGGPPPAGGITELGGFPAWNWLAGLSILLACLLIATTAFILREPLANMIAGTPTPSPTNTPTPTLVPDATPVLGPSRTPDPTLTATIPPTGTPVRLHSSGSIIYRRQEGDDRSSIFLQGPTGAPVPLLTGKERLSILDYTPHGELFAMRAEEDGDVKLYIIRADGSVIRNGINYRWTEIKSASWAPDGRNLVVDVSDDPESDNGRLVFLDAAGNLEGDSPYTSSLPTKVATPAEEEDAQGPTPTFTAEATPSTG